MLTFSLTLLPKIISFLFLTAILALYLKRKSLPSVLIRLGITVAVIFFAYSSFSKTLLTYIAWSDGFSKYFLPPYAPISYFANYSFFRFALGHIIAVAMALLIFGFLVFLKKKRPVLLDKEDASLAAFGALASGWPGLLVYFPLALLLMVFWHLFAALSPSLRGFSFPSLRGAPAAAGATKQSLPPLPPRSFLPGRCDLQTFFSRHCKGFLSRHCEKPRHSGGDAAQNYNNNFEREAISPSDSNQELRVPITAFIFIAAFVTLLFSSYILNYLGLDVLIPAKSAL